MFLNNSSRFSLKYANNCNVALVVDGLYLTLVKVAFEPNLYWGVVIQGRVTYSALSLVLNLDSVWPAMAHVRSKSNGILIGAWRD